MIEELKTKNELSPPGEPALEFPVIGSRELLLFKIEQIFTGPENSGIDIRRRALRNLSPENFIRSVKAAIEVAIADGLIPESTELSEYLDSLAVPGTRNSENKYPGRREREKRMEKMVNGVMSTLQAEHNINLMELLTHSIEELNSLLKTLHGPILSELLDGQAKDIDIDFGTTPDGGERKNLKDLSPTIRLILLLFGLMAMLSMTAGICKLSGETGGRNGTTGSSYVPVYSQIIDARYIDTPSGKPWQTGAIPPGTPFTISNVTGDYSHVHWTDPISGKPREGTVLTSTLYD